MGAETVEDRACFGIAKVVDANDGELTQVRAEAFERLLQDIGTQPHGNANRDQMLCAHVLYCPAGKTADPGEGPQQVLINLLPVLSSRQ